MPSRQQRMLLFLPIVILFAAVTMLRAQEQQTATQAEYIGKEQCAACHEEYVKAFDRNVHSKEAFRMRSKHECETCHGPGSAHIENPQDHSRIRNPRRLEPAAAAAICLQCHENGRRMFWRGGVHEDRKLSCVTCHSVHASKSERWLLKTARVEETCGTCHAQIKAMIMRTSHHPIREGLMSCNDCHDPHGTSTESMIIANSVNEQCYTCHTEKRGPFLWDHPPVRENCLNCHNPHGSNHQKLLVSKRPYLCQNCHLDTRHPGTLYDETTILTSNREFARACSNCHLNIHGSNHPSGMFFLR